MKTLIEIFNAKPEAKEKFETWYNYNDVGINENESIVIDKERFWDFPFSFQQGVVLKWLREQGIIPCFEFDEDLQKWYWSLYLFKIWGEDEKPEWGNVYIYVDSMGDIIYSDNKDYLQAIEKSIELL